MIVLDPTGLRAAIFAFQRVIWVGRDHKDHLFLSPCYGQAHLLLDQVV